MDPLPGYRDLWRQTALRAFLGHEPLGAREGIEKPAFPGCQAAATRGWHATGSEPGALSAGGRGAGETE